MKKTIFLLFLILLVFPGLSNGQKDQAEKTIEIQGTIGDYAQEDRTYEVGGEIYQFDEDILIQAQDGTPLTFAVLKGGVEIKITGVKTGDPKAKTKEKIKYIRIIVLK